MFICLCYIYLVSFFWETMSGAPAAAGCQRRGCPQSRDSGDRAGWPRSAVPPGVCSAPPRPKSPRVSVSLAKTTSNLGEVEGWRRLAPPRSRLLEDGIFWAQRAPASETAPGDRRAAGRF